MAIEDNNNHNMDEAEFEDVGGGSDGADIQEERGSIVVEEQPSVTMAQQKNFKVGIIAIALAAVIVLYMVFSGDDDTPTAEQEPVVSLADINRNTPASQDGINLSEQQNIIPELTQLEVPPLVEPPAPTPPPPPPSLPQPTASKTTLEPVPEFILPTPAIPDPTTGIIPITSPDQPFIVDVTPTTPTTPTPPTSSVNFDDVLDKIVAQEISQEDKLKAELTAEEKIAERKRTANMMLIGSGSGGGITDSTGIIGQDKVISKSDSAVFTNVGDTTTTITQGKIIETVLETAINTDIPGLLRSISSRDVYAEQGRNVLIPKGSRIIGQYSSTVARGQKRLLITWNRVIRPDGVSITLASPGVDDLGRAGVKGDIDNKYMELIASSALFSLITIGIAGAVGGDDTSSSTLSSDGSVSNAYSSQGAATAGAIGSLGSIFKDITTNMLQTAPTMTIDQGTKIKIFVNKDITFPKNFNLQLLN